MNNKKPTNRIVPAAAKIVVLSLVALLLIMLVSGNAFSQGAYPVLFEAVNKAVLSAERAGVLTNMSYNVGDRVKKGTVLARVDTGELELHQKRTTLEISYLNARLADFKQLITRGLATNEDIAKTQMELDVARTELDIVKRKISKSSIRAPFDCAIVRRYAEAHEWVTEGKPVLEVVELGAIRAVSNIPSALAVKRKKGETHQFTVHDLNLMVAGTVEALAPQVDELSNTIQVIWKVGKADQVLLPGMKGEVSID